MSLTKLTKDLNIIATLDDEPNDVGGLSAADAKAKFDEAGNAVKSFLNESLIPEMEAQMATKEEVQDIVLGQIPDGSITQAKLSSALQGEIGKIGGLQEQIDEKVDLSSKASEAEAIAGTDDTKWMTSAKTKAAIDASIAAMYEIGDIQSSYRNLEVESSGKFLPLDGRQIAKSTYPTLFEQMYPKLKSTVPTISATYTYGYTATNGGMAITAQARDSSFIVAGISVNFYTRYLMLFTIASSTWVQLNLPNSSLYVTHVIPMQNHHFILLCHKNTSDTYGEYGMTVYDFNASAKTFTLISQEETQNYSFNIQGIVKRDNVVRCCILWSSGANLSNVAQHRIYTFTQNLSTYAFTQSTNTVHNTTYYADAQAACVLNDTYFLKGGYGFDISTGSSVTAPSAVTSFLNALSTSNSFTLSFGWDGSYVVSWNYGSSNLKILDSVTGYKFVTMYGEDGALWTDLPWWAYKDSTGCIRIMCVLATGKIYVGYVTDIGAVIFNTGAISMYSNTCSFGNAICHMATDDPANTFCAILRATDNTGHYAIDKFTVSFDYAYMPKDTAFPVKNYMKVL